MGAIRFDFITAGSLFRFTVVLGVFLVDLFLTMAGGKVQARGRGGGDEG
jgi:hypothetical protein